MSVATRLHFTVRLICKHTTNDTICSDCLARRESEDVARLREQLQGVLNALEPFAKAGQHLKQYGYRASEYPGDTPVKLYLGEHVTDAGKHISAGDLRRARLVFEAIGGAGQPESEDGDA